MKIEGRSAGERDQEKRKEVEWGRETGKRRKRKGDEEIFKSKANTKRTKNKTIKTWEIEMGEKI